jgi:hypothetical protein
MLSSVVQEDRTDYKYYYSLQEVDTEPPVPPEASRRYARPHKALTCLCENTYFLMFLNK